MDTENLNEIQQKIRGLLYEHRAKPTGSPFCQCGWRPDLMLNDITSDQNQHRGHQASVIAWKVWG